MLTLLPILFLNFCNFLCRCGCNLQSRIAHAVKQHVKLPPLCWLLGGIIRKKELVYRYMITSYEVIEYLQARLLSFVLNICKVARRDITRRATFLRLSPLAFLAAFMAAPKVLKSYNGTGRFIFFIHPVSFTVHNISKIIPFIFNLPYACQVLML